MPTKIPYSARRDDLYHPCNNAAVFFPGGRPETLEALCAELSRLVYCKFESTDDTEQKVREILRGIVFNTTEFFSVAGTQGFLTTDTTQHLSVLAFRGTEAEDPTDLATDAEGWLTRHYEATIPPQVTYSITKKVLELDGVMTELDEIAERWYGKGKKRN